MVGGRFSYKGGKIKGNGAYYHQSGKEVNGTTKINASYFALDLTFQPTEGFGINPGLEILSGNDQMNPSGKNEAFNPFYGTNHKFNGFMDYFYVGNYANSVGLRDIYLNLNFKKNKFSTSLQYHNFASNGNVQDLANPTQAMKKGLGSELDLVFQYRISDQVQFDGGYSKYFSTATMETVRGGSKNASNSWGWLMVTFKPVFYKTPAPVEGQ